jgi:hypothetical protein
MSWPFVLPMSWRHTNAAPLRSGWAKRILGIGSQPEAWRVAASLLKSHLCQLFYPHGNREVTEELGLAINLTLYTDAAVVRLDNLPGDG